ncbi:hypothetical protein FNF31_06466 [Cafeteria roenbergensis]|uniref:Protein kinase domain-containing protein n=1 Tax=Cafeteria roenbergensis TaxID=33653 RepID=A0A5A8CKC6_CAFRO|nr:hypothetical protein FNF31_06466 [Cafeteria roenbergensis]
MGLCLARAGPAATQAPESADSHAAQPPAAAAPTQDPAAAPQAQAARGSGHGRRGRVKSRHARGFSELAVAPGLLAHYSVGPQIGKGHYGLVYSGTDRQTHARVAIKLLDKRRSKAHRLDLEVKVLKRLYDHPAIISLLDVFDDPESLQLVFEICTGGELFERIVNQGCYEESEAAYVATQLIEGIIHCHTHGVAHRDLKPENILLKSQDSSEIRIADFGLACLRSESETMRTVCGTWAYTAPEVRTIRIPYTRACDVWSFGVILYILLAGYHPFDPSGDAPDDEVSENVRHLNFDFDDENWDLVSDAARDLVRRCLSYERDRISAEGVLAHRWIRAHCPFGSKSSRHHPRSVQVAATTERVRSPLEHGVQEAGRDAAQAATVAAARSGAHGRTGHGKAAASGAAVLGDPAPRDSRRDGAAALSSRAAAEAASVLDMGGRSAGVDFTGDDDGSVALSTMDDAAALEPEGAHHHGPREAALQRPEMEALPADHANDLGFSAGDTDRSYGPAAFSATIRSHSVEDPTPRDSLPGGAQVTAVSESANDDAPETPANIRMREVATSGSDSFGCQSGCRPATATFIAGASGGVAPGISVTTPSPVWRQRKTGGAGEGTNPGPAPSHFPVTRQAQAGPIASRRPRRSSGGLFTDDATSPVSAAGSSAGLRHEPEATAVRASAVVTAPRAPPRSGGRPPVAVPHVAVVSATPATAAATAAAAAAGAGLAIPSPRHVDGDTDADAESLQANTERLPAVEYHTTASTRGLTGSSNGEATLVLSRQSHAATLSTSSPSMAIVFRSASGGTGSNAASPSAAAGRGFADLSPFPLTRRGGAGAGGGVGSGAQLSRGRDVSVEGRLGEGCDAARDVTSGDQRRAQAGSLGSPGPGVAAGSRSHANLPLALAGQGSIALDPVEAAMQDVRPIDLPEGPGDDPAFSFGERVRAASRQPARSNASVVSGAGAAGGRHRRSDSAQLTASGAEGPVMPAGRSETIRPTPTAVMLAAGAGEGATSAPPAPGQPQLDSLTPSGSDVSAMGKVSSNIDATLNPADLGACDCLSPSTPKILITSQRGRARPVAGAAAAGSAANFGPGRAAGASSPESESFKSRHIAGPGSRGSLSPHRSVGRSPRSLRWEAGQTSLEARSVGARAAVEEAGESAHDAVALHYGRFDPPKANTAWRTPVPDSPSVGRAAAGVAGAGGAQAHAGPALVAAASWTAQDNRSQARTPVRSADRSGAASAAADIAVWSGVRGLSSSRRREGPPHLGAVASESGNGNRLPSSSPSGPSDASAGSVDGVSDCGGSVATYRSGLRSQSSRMRLAMVAPSPTSDKPTFVTRVT